MHNDNEHRWKSTYLILHVSISQTYFRYIYSSFNSLNPNHALKRIEKYESELIISLQNIL